MRLAPVRCRARRQVRVAPSRRCTTPTSVPTPRRGADRALAAELHARAAAARSPRAAATPGDRHRRSRAARPTGRSGLRSGETCCGVDGVEPARKTRGRRRRSCRLRAGQLEKARLTRVRAKRRGARASSRATRAERAAVATKVAKARARASSCDHHAAASSALSRARAAVPGGLVLPHAPAVRGYGVSCSTSVGGGGRLRAPATPTSRGRLTAPKRDDHARRRQTWQRTSAGPWALARRAHGASSAKSEPRGPFFYPIDGRLVACPAPEILILKRLAGQPAARPRRRRAPERSVVPPARRPIHPCAARRRLGPRVTTRALKQTPLLPSTPAPRSAWLGLGSV